MTRSIDPQEMPEFRMGGIPTFMRKPYEPDLDDVEGGADFAYVGIPWDSDTVWRSGARFGPKAIRNASSAIKPYNPVTDTDLRRHNIIDYGDLLCVPGYLGETYELLEDQILEIVEHDVTPMFVSNDAMPLPILRGLAEREGPLSLVQFDAHSDLWDQYFPDTAQLDYNNGTWVHWALQEGLINPETSIRVGDQGGLYRPSDVKKINDSGIEYYTFEEFKQMGVERVIQRIQERVEGPVYVNLDLDILDPAHAPGVTANWPPGLTSWEMIQLIRGLSPLDMSAFSVMEMAPVYDDNSDSTAILASVCLFELMCAAVE